MKILPIKHPILVLNLNSWRKTAKTPGCHEVIVWFLPRVLRDVTSVDWSTTILGQKSSLPVYISATALGKLGHPDGELNLTRAAAKHGIIQMIPTLASCSFDEIVDAAQPKQPLFLQLFATSSVEQSVFSYTADT
ncbi:FMN-dependent dehydrogenase-domain-containing protein [Mycena sp. CBHHK59/15]|nr:FMN-dependent dehydrogenase-domain-containing protein [Mycena sp. CBHHK59/15]